MPHPFVCIGGHVLYLFVCSGGHVLYPFVCCLCAVVGVCFIRLCAVYVSHIEYHFQPKYLFESLTTANNGQTQRARAQNTNCLPSLVTVW